MTSFVHPLRWLFSDAATPVRPRRLPLVSLLARGLMRLPLLWLAVATPVFGAPTPASSSASQPDSDSIALRMRACTTCHGDEGRATSSGYFPRLAGKPAGYLYNQLVNFREGRRQNALMTYLVDHLGDNYLMEIANHFSRLNLPYPPPQTSGAPASVLAQGRALVMQGDPARGIPACVRCHGDAMTGRGPSIPGLLGLPRDYINAQLGAWKVGTRHALAPDCMADVAKRLTPEEISAASTWLSSQPVPAYSPTARMAPRASGAALRLPLSCGGVATGAEVRQP